MKRVFLSALLLFVVLLAGCASNQAAPAAQNGPQKIAVATAPAVTRTVPASFEETGTFAADESSDIAPLVAGRVLATPVNVGDFVKRGQVVCELDHRDAELRLEQARAQLNEAPSALHQAQSRIGLRGGRRARQLRIGAGSGAAGSGGRQTLRKPGRQRGCFPQRLR